VETDCGPSIGAGAGPGAYDRLPETARQRMLDIALILSLPNSVLLSDFACKDAGEIRVPTLLLTGDASPRQFPAAADELERCMPHVERTTIPGASHFLHGANPTPYNKTVLASLAQH
jgi:pimeloyl-ACP methyl ester carboxylesterase